MGYRCAFVLCVGVQVICIVVYLEGFLLIGNQFQKISLVEGGSRLKLRLASGESECYFAQSVRKGRKVVLMIIDAFRYDFLDRFHNNSFVKSAVNTGAAYVYQAKLQAPTVTLPRLKAILTGTVPSFADVLFNFASSEMKEENLLDLLVARNGTAVMFGDDTWLKLFPGRFARFDGTTSFVVSDYTEVDLNVTRHLSEELKGTARWDLMILHLLGLDHIGHSYGADSPLIATKLNEMDQVVSQIYDKLSLQKSDFTILVLGDHGMNSMGGHGGSSALETSVPLIFFDSQLHQGGYVDEEVQQVDVTPTLAALLDVSVPRNSLGVPLLELMENCDQKRLALLLSQAVDQLVVDESHEGTVSESNSNNIADDFDHNAVYTDYQMLLDTVNQHVELLKSACDQSEVIDDLQWRPLITSYRLVMQHSQAAINHSSIYNETLMILGLFGQCLVLLCWLYYSTFILQIRWPKFLMLSQTLLTLSFASSSLIEEEHQTRYFFFVSVLVYAVYNQLKNFKSNQTALLSAGSVLLTVAIHRFVRTVNQTGDKWNHLRDFGDLVNDTTLFNQPAALWLSALCYSLLFWYLGRGRCSRPKRLYLTLSFLLVVSFHHDYTARYWLSERGLLQARLIYLMVIAKPILIGVEWSDVLTPVLCVLSKPHNSVVIVGVTVMQRLLSTSLCGLAPVTAALIYSWFISATFFYSGNSNSFGTIDVRAGFVGIAGYHPFLNGLLIVIHTYSGPLLLVTKLTETKSFDRRTFATTLLLCNISTIAVLMAVAFLMRFHLFIWSVFAPKLLIECCHLLFTSITTGLVVML